MYAVMEKETREIRLLSEKEINLIKKTKEFLKQKRGDLKDKIEFVLWQLMEHADIKEEIPFFARIVVGMKNGREHVWLQNVEAKGNKDEKINIFVDVFSRLKTFVPNEKQQKNYDIQAVFSIEPYDFYKKHKDWVHEFKYETRYDHLFKKMEKEFFCLLETDYQVDFLFHDKRLMPFMLEELKEDDDYLYWVCSNHGTHLWSQESKELFFSYLSMRKEAFKKGKAKAFKITKKLKMIPYNL